MGRFLALSAFAIALVPSTLAGYAVNYSPVTGVSQDGNCGDGITCIGSTFGNCCSTDGTCGSTSTHCGDGCQPLFGTCPESVLNKRYIEEGAEIEERALEERATSSVCTTSGYTCVPSKTSVVKSANPTNYRSFCSSWNANKPHSLSPYTAQGILLPTGVSNACSCILADKAATTTIKVSTTAKTTTTSKTSSISLVNAGKSSSTTLGYTCVASKTLVVKSKNPSSYRSWCSSWNANKPHSLSPYTSEGLLLPTAVSNACSCILADKAATTVYPVATATSKTATSTVKTTSKATTTTSKTTSTTTSKTTSKTSTTTSSTAACTLKKRRRRRDVDAPIAL